MVFERIKALLQEPVYGRSTTDRRKMLLDLLRAVTEHHYAKCPPYRKMCDKKGIIPSALEKLEDIPYLPASIFKDALLLSIPEEEVFREIRSSATSSGRASRIGLDRANNMRWTLSMQRMLLERIGDERLKTMILDIPSVIGQSAVVPARASMTRSLLFAASDVDTCLEEDEGLLRLLPERLEMFLDDIGTGKRAMMFGFTFVLYMYAVQPYLNSGKTWNLPDLKIIHAGGWKKLEKLKVSSEKLTEDCSRCFGVKPENVIDIYGFSEQGGLLYPSCEVGVRHTPVWSDVIVRDPTTLQPLEPGMEGVMQFLTPIQTAYPGHSVITEDVGMVLGHDDCSCGRKGTTFKVIGRSQTATEERGCGDIMANLFA